MQEADTAWRFFKVIKDLNLANTFSLLWNIYPAYDFVVRNKHA